MPIETAAGTAVQWRAMAADDLRTVHALSLRVHPRHPERAEVPAEKLWLFPGGCFVLPGEGALVGYCFSHPWRDEAWPALDTFLQAMPARPSAYLIHDLTLDPQAHGRGLGRAIVPKLFEAARASALDRVNLVAVEGRAPFWSAAGFAPVADPSVQLSVRTKYGDGAVAMTRQIAGP